MRLLAVSVVSLCLAGCELIQPAASATPDPALVQAQVYATSHPIGRFQNVGKREFNNGTEVYVLDTQTGQVCYFFIATGAKTSKDAQSTDFRSCAGEALAPL